MKELETAAIESWFVFAKASSHLSLVLGLTKSVGPPLIKITYEVKGVRKCKNIF